MPLATKRKPATSSRLPLRTLAITPTIAPITVQSEELVITGTSTVHSTQTDSAESTTNGVEDRDDFNLNPGYSGFGYTDFGSDSGDAITGEFVVDEAGQYDLTIRFASSGSRPMDVTVGGASERVDFAGDNFTTWNILTLQVELVVGSNTV